MVYLGHLSVKHKNAIKIKPPKVKIMSFIEANSAELYIEIMPDTKAISHTVYQVTNSGKLWLGKTKSKNYYVAEVKRLNNETQTIIEVVSEAKDGTKSKASQQILNWD